jgi:isoquinoline 1-oxidoreductase beta subunit
VQWTREDDLRHDYYHSPSVQALAAGLDAGSKVVAWRHRVAYPSIAWIFDGKQDRASDFELDLGVFDLPLAIPNVRVESCAAPAHVRIGWLRSVANIQQAFAVQSFIAELAHLLNRDPKDMLLEVLGDSKDPITEKHLGLAKVGNYGAPLDKHPISRERFRGVIDAVTKAADWTKSRSSGRALGLAVHRSFLSYVAVVASVSKSARGVQVDEAWIAADCGTVINTDRVRAQLEGAFIFGQTIAFHGEITMKAGAVVQGNFHEHKLARLPEAPRAIHIELIRSTAPPGGVGEPGVPPVAPAIANAVFALTGTRHRSLPMR